MLKRIVLALLLIIFIASPTLAKKKKNQKDKKEEISSEEKLKMELDPVDLIEEKMSDLLKERQKLDKKLEQLEKQVNKVDKELKSGFGRMQTRMIDQDSKLGSKIIKLEDSLEAFKAENLARLDMELGANLDITTTLINARDVPFTPGSLLLYFSKNFANIISFATAIDIYNSKPLIRSAFFDLVTTENRTRPYGNMFNSQGFHLQAGRFELPFGLDYKYLIPFERISISAPLTTDIILRNLSDLNEEDWQNGPKIISGNGIRTFYSTNFFDLAAYMVNGKESDYLHQQKGMAMGGSIHFYPIRETYLAHKSGSEQLAAVGFSYLVNIDNDFNKEFYLISADIDIRSGPVGLQGEYVFTEDRQQENRQWGYYCLFSYHFDLLPAYFFSRFEQWKPKDTKMSTVWINNELSKISAGLGYRISNFLLVKGEYENYLDSTIFDPALINNTIKIQVVGKF